jgi:hypothetical protein
MSTAVYRFLPWARRGLAGALPSGDPDAAPLPARAGLDIGIHVSGVADAVPANVHLHGPGDVIGLDPTVIVRTTPRAGTTDVEPNYLVAVDFDQPELPWLFTPTGARASGHIPPWLVLVVVEDRPGVSVTVPRGAPLPVLHIDSGAGAELPDLADSWAWAHAQLLDADGAASSDQVASALHDHPDHNVSRLVCPRHLRANASWIAALVPAFDAGVSRGLGATPQGDSLGPAWSNVDTVSLPVYFHWTFTTGPEGDFESLARRLHPFQVDSSVGRIPMHVGDAAPPMRLPHDDPHRILDMDGALMAPIDEPGTLADVDQRVRDGLRTLSALVADAADGHLDGHADPTPTSAQPVGPPVYGEYAHRDRVVRDPEPTVWFDEANTDPRSRVAAGLGAEVLRANQEDVVAAAWDQVGDVLAAQAALSRARLGLEAARRFHERHVLPVADDRMIGLGAPLAGRALLGQVTVQRAVAQTSVPDAVLDGALRRLTAPGGRLMSRASRRLGGQEQLRTGLVDRFATGKLAVDPTRFSWVAIDGFAADAVTAHGDGTSSLAGLGIALTVPDTTVQQLRTDIDTMTKAPAAEGLALRDDLSVIGLVTSAQLDAARTAARTAVAASTAAGATLSTGTLSVLSQIVDASATSTSSSGLQIDLTQVVRSGGGVQVHGVSIRSSGQVSIRDAATDTSTTVGRVTPGLMRSASAREIVAALPAGALPSPSAGAAEVVVHTTAASGAVRVTAPGRGVVTGPVLHPPPVVLPPVAVPPVVVPVDSPVAVITIPGTVLDLPGTVSVPATMTVPRLTTDSAVLATFRSAVSSMASSASIVGVVEPVQSFVALDIASASSALKARSDPMTSHVSRRDAMISLAGEPVGRLAAGMVQLPGWLAPPAADRVMAFPQFDRGAYEMLAAFDRNRFCPGIDEVPPDSVTLLRTNPRFIAAFLAGLNQETERELLWRRYPTDQRGTPFQRFWTRLDGKVDIAPMHEWTEAGLGEQTADGKQGVLVLLVRGQLLRRYPNALVVAVPATGPRTPSTDGSLVMAPVLAGRFDPDVSFFGFPLTREQVVGDPGWFFALMEPPTEPRFGLDETSSVEHPTRWDDVSWAHLPDAAEGKHLTSAMLRSLSLSPSGLQADETATALFQRPFKLLVHARHLVKEQP